MRRSVRKMVQARAESLCEYCRCPATHTTDVYVVERMETEGRGGSNEPDNLAFSCSGCNAYKPVSTAGNDPLTQTAVPLFHPRTQVWGEHFAWDATKTVVNGQTPTGRATVERLRLNREPVVNLRRVPIAAGLHPPEEDP